MSLPVHPPPPIPVTATSVRPVPCTFCWQIAFPLGKQPATTTFLAEEAKPAAAPGQSENRHPVCPVISGSRIELTLKFKLWQRKPPRRSHRCVSIKSYMEKKKKKNREKKKESLYQVSVRRHTLLLVLSAGIHSYERQTLLEGAG